MLRILSADALSDREGAMASLISESAAAGRRVFVIVPDQFSFEYDKMLYKRMGAKPFNDLITGGFNRICELICKKHGGYAGDNAGENLSVILMYLAIKAFKAEGGVKYYSKSLNKGSFIQKMIALVREFRQSGITPEAVMLACEQNEGMLSRKLYDISRIYSNYMNELISRELKDDCDGVSAAVRLAGEFRSFEGADIYIDAFHSFTYNEYDLIKVMLSQADSVTVGLMIGNGKNSFTPLSPFAEPVKTRTALELAAKDLGVRSERVYAPVLDGVSPEIDFVNKHIFTSVKKNERYKADETVGSSGNIRIISAADIYEEAEYVCAEIRRLVRDEGLDFGECAVLLRDPEANKSAITSIFERYDIPFFIDCPEPISQYSFVMYFEGLFKCLLTKEYKTENIMRIIKSPLSHFYEYEASLLEDYCVAWNVDGDMWKSEFTAKDKSIPDDSKYLKCVNEYREKIILPLERFKKNSDGKNARGISEALYTLLDDIRLSDRSFSMVKVSLGDNDEKMVETSRKFRQLWELAVSCISAVFKNIPEEELTLRQYFELIRTMFANINVSAPPQMLDTVTVGDSSHSRIGHKRAVFVMNCCDGVFPADIKSNGLITDNEKQRLEINTGIEFPDNMVSKTDHERLVCYTALTASTDRLYMLWHECDSKGKQQRRSSLVGSIKNMFERDIEIKASSMPVDFYCPSKKTAYVKYLEHCHDKGSETASLRRVLEQDKAYREKIDYLISNSNKRDFRLDKASAHELFFAGDLNLSATRLKTYYNCPFSYFCQYGLKIYPPVKDKTDPRNRGTFVHSCLEKILSKKDKNGREVYNEDFVSITDEQIENKIHEFFEQYLESELGGDFGKTARFDFISHRWEESAFYVVRNLRDELALTLFRPVGFEFDLTKENNESILKITCKDKYVINIRGSIDRVDIFEHKDDKGELKRYVRIIDYKTGAKELKLEELYNGLNLQMLIYLLALTSSENELTEKGRLIPSGVLYMPAVHVSADKDSNAAYDKGIKGDLEAELERYRYDKFKRFGLIVDNQITIEAMDKITNRFVDIYPTGNKKTVGSVLLEEGELEAYEEFAYEKIIEMADALYEGRIEAVPLYTDKNTASCKFCEYKAVCRNAYARVHREVTPDDKQKMISRINKIMNKGDNNGLDE